MYVRACLSRAVEMFEPSDQEPYQRASQRSFEEFGLRIPCNCLHYLGGCQNYGTFLGPYYSTAPNI